MAWAPQVSLAPDLTVKVLEASLEWQEALIEEAVEQENEPLVLQGKGEGNGWVECCALGG